jgi:hypothetical protein
MSLIPYWISCSANRCTLASSQIISNCSVIGIAKNVHTEFSNFFFLGLLHLKFWITFIFNRPLLKVWFDNYTSSSKHAKECKIFFIARFCVQHTLKSIRLIGYKINCVTLRLRLQTQRPLSMRQVDMNNLFSFSFLPSNQKIYSTFVDSVAV